MKTRKVAMYLDAVDLNGLHRGVVSLPYPFVGEVSVLAKYDRKLKKVVFKLIIDGHEYR